MHGIINRALELMVIQKFGEEFWDKLKEEAGIRLNGEFLVTEFYSDESTYKLVVAATKLTGLKMEQILELYGEYFYEYSVEFGYFNLLRVLGKNPADFLMNLDTMHLALARVYPPLMPPLYTCEKLPNGDLTLYYFSKRANLEPIAVGLIRRTIKELFGISVEVTVIQKRADKGYCKLLIKTLNIDDTLHGDVDEDDMVFECLCPAKQPRMINPMTFTHVLPFHIIFDRDLRVQQCGLGLLRKVPHLLNKDIQLNQVARIVRPNILLNFEAIQEHMNSVFLVTITPTAGLSFRLNGQMIYLLDNDLMLYIGSPYVVDLSDLHMKGFQIADLSLHDAKRDFILAAETFEEERVLLKKLEDLTSAMQRASKELSREKAKTDRLLFNILPRPVAKELKLGKIVPPQRFESVTILFSGIVNFDKFTQHCDATHAGLEIVNLLNKVYKALDSLLDPTRNPEIYKIETIHDNYLCVSGAPEPTLFHAKRAARLALDMMDSLDDIGMSGSAVKLTIGINSGEVVAGVIGQRMPRYCLFGDSVNLASRTLKYGKKGRINLAQSAYKLLQTGYNQDRTFSFESYGEVIMKNVNQPVKIWLLERKAEPMPKTFSRVCEIV
ncbi:Guanylate cyclase soluble subunit beta-1 [Hypsibius exemplaris]|uniref:Guanylate cyclase soluble subunit beta-1 n=1 Tax=Hypsibius exemplaris TaxID=2072580 RepID=A0A1W0WWQ2_HYPEX|nr:Guanylate cyclase soluble subunit beta-1 [Hypsibius exemplaris]